MDLKSFLKHKRIKVIGLPHASFKLIKILIYIFIIFFKIIILYPIDRYKTFKFFFNNMEEKRRH